MIVEAILKEEEQIRKESKAEGLQIGEARGVQIGEARGKLVAERQTLSRLLAKRFPVTIEQNKKFAAYFEYITDFEALEN